MKPWKGSRVSLRWLPDHGTWLAVDKLTDGWIEISPLDQPARELANISPTGKLWIQTRDLTRLPEQEEQIPWNSTTAST